MREVDVFFLGRVSTKSIVDVTEEPLIFKSRFSLIDTSDVLSNETIILKFIRLFCWIHDNTVFDLCTI